MARMDEYLIELRIGKNPSVEKVFNQALGQVYSTEYLNKIESVLTKRIKLKEKVLNNANEVAWNQGTNIYVNRPVFYSKPVAQQMRYLLHEFVHVLHHSKGFLFMRNFKEVKKLTDALWKVMETEVKDKGKFLTGKSIDKKYLNKEETLSYLMNDSVKWNEITPQGRQQFINELKRSQMFNLDHPFWKKRLT
jgi:hypothetical protein